MSQPLPPNPYVGPVPFQSGKKLYGRSSETNQMIDLLVAERIVLLYSPSGAGKTSLINAALLPELTEMNFVVQGPARVSQPPDEDLVLAADQPVSTPEALPPGDLVNAQAPSFNRFVFSVMAGLNKNAEDRVSRDDLLGMTLQSYVERTLKEMDNEYLSLLLVFDQFEEILTIDPLDHAPKEYFFKELGRALENPQVWALFVIREDFLGGLTPYLSYIPTRLSKRFRLDLLGVEAASEAIRMPATEVDASFDKDAADKLVENLRTVRVQDPEGRPRMEMGPYIEPVQLQVICQSLWERERPDPQHVTAADVENFGSVDDALAMYYAEVMEKTARANNLAERTIRDWVEFQLITTHGMRSQVLRGELITMGLENKVVDELINAFLVRKETRLGSVWFELAHDRLVDPIKQSNAAWRETNLNAFQKTALIWELQGRPAGSLLRGAELSQAEAWADEHNETLTAIERQLLTFSQVAVQQADRGRDLEAERRTNLEDLGWGVIFPADADPAWVDQTRNALKELLDWRKSQAGSKHENYYREFIGGDGARKDETARHFLTRHKVGMIQSTPDKMPGYLLIIGSPEQISFEFQYGLDFQYSVGRIYFKTAEEFAIYARSVVTCEKDQFALPRKATIFAPINNDSKPTELAYERLVSPLLQWAQANLTGWEVEQVVYKNAIKEKMKQLFGMTETPSFFFFSGHGMVFPKSHPEQTLKTGALVCQDWRGPHSGPVTKDHFFDASDIGADARLLGSIAFLFASHSAGFPQFENFAAGKMRVAKEISDKPFLSRLPQRMLAHPNGGMLGVIGHVDDNWNYSFQSSGNQADTAVFEETLNRVMNGYTLGAALEPFNQRYAMWSAELADKTREYYYKANFTPELASEPTLKQEIGRLEVAMVDARNYIIIGDPAVRLPIERGVAVSEHPVIEPVTGFEQSMATEVPVTSEILSVVEPQPVPAPSEPEPSGAEPEETPQQTPVEAAPQTPQPVEEKPEQQPVQAGEISQPSKDFSLDETPVQQQEQAQAVPQYEYTDEPPAKKAGLWTGARKIAATVKGQTDQMAVFNGLDGSTGDYSLPQITINQFATLVGTSMRIDQKELATLDGAYKRLTSGYHKGDMDLDQNDLAQVGWGLIVAPFTSAEVLRALDPLLELRRRQAGKFFKIFEGSQAPQRGEIGETWLARMGSSARFLDPDRVPYYLLIVGEPHDLPFEFSRQLGPYATGRLSFNEIGDYNQYANKVAELELRDNPRQRRVEFFGARNPDDQLTRLMDEGLLRTLPYSINVSSGWSFGISNGEKATKKNLIDTVLSYDGPSLLAAGGHGMVYPPVSRAQEDLQGALLCSDWPGPNAWRGPVPDRFFFSAQDLPYEARLDGMFSVVLASFSAGTPSDDPTVGKIIPGSGNLAPRSFISRLAQRMLAQGSAGFVGLAGRMWSYSIELSRSESEIRANQDFLLGLLAGKRIGAAMEPLRLAYIESRLQMADAFKQVYSLKLNAIKDFPKIWAQNMTLKSVTLIGDPAARITQPRGMSF